MLIGMGLLMDSFWRAAAYCLRPRVIMLSLVPLLLTATALMGAAALEHRLFLDEGTGWQGDAGHES